MKMISMTKATLCVLGLGMGMAAFAADDLPKGPHPIPHPIDGYVPLTQQMNMCAMCHRETGKAPAPDLALPVWNVPKSHFNADGTLNGKRDNCVMCHAPMKEFSKFKPRDLNDRPTD